MNNKLTNILLVVLILTIIIVGYLLIMKKNTTEYKIENENPIDVPINNSDFDPKWDTLSEDKMMEIISIEKDIYYEEDSGLNLLEEIDLTGDSINEAIIGGNGINNEVSFIFIKDINDEISIAKQKNKDGSLGTVSLISIGRAMIGEGYELISEKNGFYTISLELDESTDNPSESYFKCRADGLAFYAWNKQTKLFEWNKSLTDEYTTKICK